MATIAYLLIKASAAVRHNGYREALEDLRALSEIEYAEPVSGLYDCVARVEAPITSLIFLVHKIMANSWAECVHVLRVEEPVEPALDWEEARSARLRRQREIIKAYRAGLQRLPRSPQHPYAGQAAAIRAELEEARSLRRQLEILKADHQKRRTPATPAPHR